MSRFVLETSEGWKLLIGANTDVLLGAKTTYSIVGFNPYVESMPS